MIQNFCYQIIQPLHVFLQAMKANDCDWANKNQVLQKELRDTLTSALQETEHEEHSLTSLEKVNVL